MSNRSPPAHDALDGLVTEIRACTFCSEHLPLGPRPVVRLGTGAKLLVIGQAPGTKVHASGVPWDDASGERLRAWMDVDRQVFYDVSRIAIMPMGFCYPGRGRGGDLPPRPECAPRWHERALGLLPEIRLTLLIGQYAQARYLDTGGQPLEQTVRDWRQHLARGFLPLPHPSPRNTMWLRKRPWFEAEVVPALQAELRLLFA
jgi:uracil-DNA glycosylase